ncbi:hypothetical protein CJ014_22930 [Pleomorphomonas carboxyditropha]|uniref:Uncharacterized protein n=2 Tax=Pleomorphomonas carboxyditropha TaxID=2023338 RepID=A0A2G9WQ56_9HYPH|nr:hypothetical protein CJ014_22930 [Pleomorphomonas carboxyditropha]
MKKVLITLAIFFAMAGTANADPIFTPIFTYLFSVAGFTGAALSSISLIATARATRLIIGRGRQ